MKNDPNAKTLRIDRSKVLGSEPEGAELTPEAGEKRVAKEILLTLGEWEHLKSIGDGNAALGISTCLAAYQGERPS
jgi:hypothetical protein